MEIDKDKLLGYECKHAVYTKGGMYDGQKNDLIFLKLNAHMKDGSIIPTTKQIINFERPFWVTKKGFRKYKEKKEFEQEDRLQKYMTRQSNLVPSIKKAIFAPGNTLREVCANPYIFGADITSTAIVKEAYMRKFPGLTSENTLAVLDIETDVVHGTEDPILVSITFGGKAVMCATSLYTNDIPNFEEEMKKYYKKRIKDVPEIDARNIDLEVYACATPLEAIERCMAKAHEWQPDFLTCWNIDFDVPRIIECIEKYNGSVNDIFSDPSVPKEFRNAWYQKGQAKKVTASGKEEPLHWTDMWHTMHCPASFYMIDQACLFRKVRMAKGREASYALDSILKKYTNISKLKNEKADSMSGLEWHRYMQSREKLEYGVYNIVDCAACEVLDEIPEVRDIKLSISMTCGFSDYAKFNSQPRRTVDDMHFLCLELGTVIGTTPKDLETEYDRMTVSIKDWINRVMCCQ